MRMRVFDGDEQMAPQAKKIARTAENGGPGGLLSACLAAAKRSRLPVPSALNAANAATDAFNLIGRDPDTFRFR